MPPFTKEKDKKLISLVQSKPFLYKPSEPGYKDQLAKSLAWEEISDKLEIPIPAVRRRWKYIKDKCRQNAPAKSHNDIDSKFNDTEIDLRDQMYRKKINGKWCTILPPPKEDHDDKEDETGDLGLKKENSTTILNHSNKSFDDTDDTTDLSDTEDRKYVNVSKYQRNGIVIENLETGKTIVLTPVTFNTFDSERKKIMDDLKQKHARGITLDKKMAQFMKILKIGDEIDDIQSLNEEKRKIISNTHDEYFKRHGKIDSDNKSKCINNSDIMDILRQKLGFCVTLMEEYKSIYNISNPEKGPMHKFFEEAASIVTMFPPYLACEASLMIFGEIIDYEIF